MGYFIAAMVLFGFLFSGIAFQTGSAAPVTPAPPARTTGAVPTPSPSATTSPSPTAAGAAVPGVNH